MKKAFLFIMFVAFVFGAGRYTANVERSESSLTKTVVVSIAEVSDLLKKLAEALNNSPDRSIQHRRIATTLYVIRGSINSNDITRLSRILQGYAKMRLKELGAEEANSKQGTLKKNSA